VAGKAPGRAAVGVDHRGVNYVVDEGAARTLLRVIERGRHGSGAGEVGRPPGDAGSV
jgi:hypothetical protein